MLISILFGIANGRIEDVTTASMDGAKEAVTMSISLLGAMCLWSGFMEIAKEGGVTKYCSKLFKPVIKFLFPKLPENSPASEAIVMNMVANLFGMSNAATPLGLKAMGELDKLHKKSYASDEMCMFAVLNTASLQLIPSTMIVLRQTAGSANPFEIIPLVWIASLISITVGVVSAKLFSMRKRI